MLGLRVHRQGHWWIEGVNLLGSSRSRRVWFVNTEQKYPDAYPVVVDGQLQVYLRSRDGSMLFRPCEDGSRSTVLAPDLPRVRAGEEWAVYTENDKWGVWVVAVRQRKLGWWRVGRRWWASGPRAAG